MNYAKIGHIHKVIKDDGFGFAAMAIDENEKYIKFQNSAGVLTLLNKNAIREMVDLGKPKGGV